MPSLRVLRPSLRHAGFTLLELMIVVVIVGVLAVIAIPSFTSYVQRSRMAEAATFLGEIKQRQEAYRAEFGQYCDATGSTTSFVPTATPAGGNKITWPPNSDPSMANWVQLGAIPDGATRFQYAVDAALPGNHADLDGTYNFPPNDFVFVAVAQGDLDGDGNVVQVEALSHRASLWVSSPSGWE